MTIILVQDVYPVMNQPLTTLTVTVGATLGVPPSMDNVPLPPLPGRRSLTTCVSLDAGHSVHGKAAARRVRLWAGPVRAVPGGQGRVDPVAGGGDEKVGGPMSPHHQYLSNANRKATP